MSPTLARFICLARSRIYGTELGEDAKVAAQQAEAIQQFKLFLTANIQLEVRIELLLGSEWEWNPHGRSVRFKVDEHTFVLQQSDQDCRLLHRLQGRDVPLAVLPADNSFEDHLLVTIDDAMKA
jgi:hypothetical protein